MVVTVNTWRPVDFAILGVTGAAVAFALFGAWYTIPWRRRSRRAEGTKEYNLFWRSRAALELLCALWLASQLLRLSVLWGAKSFLFPAAVTDWTGAGWLCRIYLTAALGVFQPLCSLLTLLMFAAAVRRKPPPPRLPPEERPPGGARRKERANVRLLLWTLLAAAPVAAAQGVVAWISLALRVGGERCEERPRSVLGYFFAAFWFGDAQQCAGVAGCTLCVFPAAAIIVHAAFTAAYLVALWVTSSRMAAAVLNKRLKRRLRFFQLAASLLALAGVGALGGSVVTGPWSWVNQGCWIGYFVTVVATVALVSLEVVIWPQRDLSKMTKRLKTWMDPGEGLSSSEGTYGEGYIKAVQAPQALEGALPAPSTPRADPVEEEGAGGPSAVAVTPLTAPPMTAPLLG